MNEHDPEDDRSMHANDDGTNEEAPSTKTYQSPVGAVLTRTAACIYDFLLLVAVLFVVTALLIATNDGEAFGPLYLLVVFAIAWLFFDWFWRHGGQTLGMQAWRLRLVDDGDVPLTRGRTFARFALGCLLFGITYVTVPFDERRRAIHDRLTRTRMVRMPKGWKNG